MIVAAGPGLGLAVALRFAREGWSVGLIARSSTTLDGLASVVRREAGVPVVTATADAGDESALRAALRSVAGDLGEASVLVYNGSAYVEGSVLTLPPTALRHVLEVGVTGALVAAQEVAPAMRRRGSGAILLTGSVAADRASTSAAAVGVAKAGLRSIARSLHKEVAGSGVRVVSVTIAGALQGPRALDVDAIAARYWHLATGATVPEAVETFPSPASG